MGRTYRRNSSREVEVTCTVVIDGEELDATATVEVSGSYSPGTHLDPPEYPDTDVLKVVVDETGAEVPVESLSKRERERVEDWACDRADSDA